MYADNPVKAEGWQTLSRIPPGISEVQQKIGRNAAISLKLAGGLCVEQARCGKSWLQE
jgi:hypothetical protein